MKNIGVTNTQKENFINPNLLTYLLMKTINEVFSDEEFEKLKEAKDGDSWHDFILNNCLEAEE